MDDNERLEDHEQRLERLEAASAKLKPIVKKNSNNLRSLTIGLVFLVTIAVATISPKYTGGAFTLETRGLTIEAIIAGSVCVTLVFNKNADALAVKLLDRFLGK